MSPEPSLFYDLMSERDNHAETGERRIEEGFETAKNEFGHDHNETRSWHGWHRYVSLVMLAYDVMPSVRYQTNSLKPKKL